MIRIAIIGCGFWGTNLIRVFGEISDSNVVLLCDSNEDRLRLLRERYPHIVMTSRWEDVPESSDVDAVVIATDASTHFPIAHACLLKGKHVLVEKPLATSTADAKILIQTAAQRDRILLVDHTFLYNVGIRKIKQLMRGGGFGRVYYLHATRTNLGPIRVDVDSFWDLASHDVSIFNYLLDAQPEWVSAVGAAFLSPERADVGFATLAYPGGVIANAHNSWLDPNKVREVVVVGSRQRIVFDDLNNVERVRIFEKGVTSTSQEVGSFGEFRLLVRDGDIISPWIETGEPLRELAAHFLDCVNQRARPLTDGTNGLDVVRVLCAIDQSMAQNGAPVKVV